MRRVLLGAAAGILIPFCVAHADINSDVAANLPVATILANAQAANISAADAVKQIAAANPELAAAAVAAAVKANPDNAAAIAKAAAEGAPAKAKEIAKAAAKAAPLQASAIASAVSSVATVTVSSTDISSAANEGAKEATPFGGKKGGTRSGDVNTGNTGASGGASGSPS